MLKISCYIDNLMETHVGEQKELDDDKKVKSTFESNERAKRDR